jgi:exopolyphosphatase/guanosine-5'-triphosphate,3'-diphosphate pyrophosphatase
MRVATIDIGTNTVLLLVAERRDHSLVAVTERATITRLGENVDATRTLSPAAIARTNECLDRYAEVVASSNVDRVAVVGTSAMRDAGGGDVVRAHVKARFGVEARTISGGEEARLTFAGALSGISRGGERASEAREATARAVARVEGAGPVTVFDIGGGSTEVVHGVPGGEMRYAKSFDVGSVRLTDRHIRNDPPTEMECASVFGAARDAFASIPRFSSEASEPPPVGIAGTMTTLAAVSLAMHPYDGARVHGLSLETSEVERVVRRLATLPLDARKAVTGLEPKRADVIVAGGFIALAFLAKVGAKRVTISDRGVRWGLAEELAQPS